MPHSHKNITGRDEMSIITAQTYGMNPDENSSETEEQTEPNPIVGGENTEEEPDKEEDQSLNPTEIVFKTLPERLEEKVEALSDVFGEMGVNIVGFGSVDLDDESLSSDNEFVGTTEDIDSIDLHCAIAEGSTRFVYTIYPQKKYDGVLFRYDLLNQFFLTAEPELFNGADPEQQVNIINRVVSQLSQEDVSLLLEANRNVSLPELNNWLSDIRLQLPEYSHQIGQTNSGELTNVSVQKRLYCEEFEEDVEEIYQTVQEITNLYVSYNIIAQSVYLDDGVNIPDSTFKLLEDIELTSEPSSPNPNIGFQ